MKSQLIPIILLARLVACSSFLFLPSPSVRRRGASAVPFGPARPAAAAPSWRLYDISTLKEYLAREYPLFDSLLLSKNQDLWKALSEAGDDGGATVFAPSDRAMEALGAKRLGQLRDVRNEETAQKMAAFHVVGERVTAAELFDSGGVVTLGGVVDVGRSVRGGFFGFGGTEDGGVTLGGANVVSTRDINGYLIHEVDALISPQILWRYCDQLRIPGSK